MIVMKFGGTSLADADRILSVAEIVRGRTDARPVVVVSALAGVTDLLVAAAELARTGDREALEPVLAGIERKHRWAAAGAVRDASERHDLTLALDALFEELRQLLRAVRILGEGTPRFEDTLLALGETLSARIVTSAFVDRGLAAVAVDPREVIVTDGRHGEAEPDLPRTEERSRTLLALVEAGRIPVLGGFVGATRDGRTTTLGRGGSDTTAAVLGACLRAQEIQIWTDVPGILSADPRIVPGARTRSRVSFAEAAELAYYGAKVLHAASIAPAVKRSIPVRVLSSLDPASPGTVILGEADPQVPALASVASRGGLSAVRLTSKRMRMDAGFLPRVLAAFDAAGIVPDLVVSSEVSVTLIVPGRHDLASVTAGLGDDVRAERMDGRAIVCIVGGGLATDAGLRSRVLAALAAVGPEIAALGGSATSVAAVLPEASLADAVRELHRRFFEVEGVS